MSGERRVSLALSILVLLSALLGYATLTRGHDWGGDFAGYILQGRSLVEGDRDRTLESLRFTMDFSSQSMGPRTYPWGFPIILSAAYLVAGLDLMAFKLVGILFFVLFLICLFHLFSYALSAERRLILVAFFALNPDLLGFLDHVLSDIPFLFFSTLSILLIDRIVIQGRTLVSVTADRVLLGAVPFAAFFIRGNGLLLLAVLLTPRGEGSPSDREFPGSCSEPCTW